MNQKTLDLIGRHHTVEQVIDSFRLAERGWDLRPSEDRDLIVGLPGEHMEDVERTMSVDKGTGSGQSEPYIHWRSRRICKAGIWQWDK